MSGEGGGSVEGALGHMAELAPQPPSPFQMSVSAAHERWGSSKALPATASASVPVSVSVVAWNRTEFVAWRMFQRHFVFNFRNSVSRKIFAI